MKRAVFILSVLCVSILLALILTKPLIITLAKKQLAEVFTLSRVSIGGVRLEPAQGISFFDIAINRPSAYDIEVKEAAIIFNLFSFPKSFPLRLIVNGTSVSINSPDKGIKEITGLLKTSKGKPLSMIIEVADLIINLRTSDLSAKANLSAEINLTAQTLSYLDLLMPSFEFFGIRLRNTALKLKPQTVEGTLHIEELSYDKLKITDFKSAAKIAVGQVMLSDISARILGGEIRGDLDFAVKNEIGYLADINCSNLDIAKFVRDFKLQDKFEMTGKINGGLKLQGNAKEIEILAGTFSTLEPGGTLVIKDGEFLKNMAKQAKQPKELFVESFKNYRYNSGVITPGLDNGNIALSIGLEGETGKRNLTVTYIISN